jgi:hypothetical protein
MVESKKKKGQGNIGKPISLKPLKFDEAVSDLLKVKPEAKQVKSDTDDSKAKSETK